MAPRFKIGCSLVASSSALPLSGGPPGLKDTKAMIQKQGKHLLSPVLSIFNIYWSY